MTIKLPFGRRLDVRLLRTGEVSVWGERQERAYRVQTQAIAAMLAQARPNPPAGD